MTTIDTDPIIVTDHYGRDHSLAAVIFDCGDRTPVPAREAFAASDGHKLLREPLKVVWANGRTTWAKGWWERTSDGYRLVRIGAGAYGDFTVLERDCIVS